MDDKLNNDQKPTIEEKLNAESVAAVEEKPTTTPSTPAVEAKPSVQSTPAIEAKPAEATAPVVEEKTAVQLAPAIEEKPKEIISTPVIEDKPAVQDVPVVAATAEAKPAEQEKPVLENKLALVIEDDYDASMISVKALESLGLEPEAIRDGNVAIARLAEVVPVVVILDLHLPNVDGMAILTQIRADERLAKTRVIVVSADARMADVLKQDADMVLLKPTTYTQVKDFAARLLMRR